MPQHEQAKLLLRTTGGVMTTYELGTLLVNVVSTAGTIFVAVLAWLQFRPVDRPDPLEAYDTPARPATISKKVSEDYVSVVVNIIRKQNAHFARSYYVFTLAILTVCVIGAFAVIHFYYKSSLVPPNEANSMIAFLTVFFVPLLTAVTVGIFLMTKRERALSTMFWKEIEHILLDERLNSYSAARVVEEVGRVRGDYAAAAGLSIAMFNELGRRQ